MHITKRMSKHVEAQRSRGRLKNRSDGFRERGYACDRS